MKERSMKYYACLWVIGVWLMFLGLFGNIGYAIVGGFIFLACHVGVGLESLQSGK